MIPAISDPDLTVYRGDALAVLPELPSESVHVIVTSPPYFGLRAYLPDGHPEKHLELGTERTPQEYVARLVAIMREVRRVLRSDGVCWLNVDDSFVAGRLALVPQRLAVALQDDGWLVRCDVVWEAPDAMTESVTDRPTRSHEYVFMLTKTNDYYYDIEPTREPYATNGKPVALPQAETLGGLPPEPARMPDGRRATANHVKGGDGSAQPRDGERWAHSGRNRRSVWRIVTPSFPGAHFAVFPEKLVADCLTGCVSEAGCCPSCGAQWVRVVDRDGESTAERVARQPVRWQPGGEAVAPRGDGGLTQGGVKVGLPRVSRTVGWRPGCACVEGEATVACTVMDPFFGSGTVGRVARRFGARCVGVELNDEYVGIAAERTAQLGLL